jgi:hypothetical protein
VPHLVSLASCWLRGVATTLKAVAVGLAATSMS